MAEPMNAAVKRIIEELQWRGNQMRYGYHICHGCKRHEYCVEIKLAFVDYPVMDICANCLLAFACELYERAREERDSLVV